MTYDQFLPPVVVNQYSYKNNHACTQCQSLAVRQTAEMIVAGQLHRTAVESVN